MVQYAINVYDFRIVAATGETLKQSAYRALSAKTAEDIRTGRITPKEVVWQMLRDENVHGRKPEDVEGLRPDNVRRVAFRQEAEEDAADGGFVAEVGAPQGAGQEPGGDNGGNGDNGEGGGGEGGVPDAAAGSDGGKEE